MRAASHSSRPARKFGGAYDGALGEAILREHVRARPAGYKVPKTVHFVETIPYSPVGKILRRALRDPLWEGERWARNLRYESSAAAPCSR